MLTSKTGWLTKPQLLQKTRLSYPTIWHKTLAGDFPRGYAVGGRILWDEAEVETWMKSRCQTLKGDGGPRPPRHANMLNVGKTVDA